MQSNGHVTIYVGPAHVTRKQLRFISEFTIEHVDVGDDEAKRNLQDGNLCLVADIIPPFHRDRYRCWRSRRVLLQRVPTRNMAARLHEQG